MKLKIPRREEGQRFILATDIAKNLGIVSRASLPHSHAVTAIIAQLSLFPWEKKKGYVEWESEGVTRFRALTLYHPRVEDLVAEWLLRADYPADIAGQKLTYHVKYEGLRPPQISMFEREVRA